MEGSDSPLWNAQVIFPGLHHDISHQLFLSGGTGQLIFQLTNDKIDIAMYALYEMVLQCFN